MSATRYQSLSSKPLTTPLHQLRGVGPRIAEKLAKIGLSDVESALYSLPLRYEDRRNIRKISQLHEQGIQVFTGKILAAGESQTARKHKKLYEVVVSDGTGQLSLKWFHYRKPLMQQRFVVGQQAIFIGEPKRFGAVREVHHPEVIFIAPGQTISDFTAADPLSHGCYLPVYALTDGLHQKTARKIWREAVEGFAPLASSPLPEDIRQRQGLLPLSRALQLAHWPTNETLSEQLETGTDLARRSLVFDEFFFLELGLALRRKGIALEEGFSFTVAHQYTAPLAKMLPYRLTDAQRRVLNEIKQDMMAPRPMNRLLQGDVGSGKTIVALMSALIAIENHTQVAVVAPTEILAEQHFSQFQPWLEQLGLKAVYLSGSTTAKDKKSVLQQISAGEVDMLVGTHAVLQQGVDFHKLGLGIIDEQHRFGVRQRAALRKKGHHPDLLVMTATPIPRSLALTVYGDLSLSVIDELPPGRRPIKTRVLSDRDRPKAYQQIHAELSRGQQAYIVYPLVEETEKSDLLAASESFDYLRQEVFPDFQLGLLHGRLKSEEKEQMMRAFKAGDIQLLIATTVIEVGIDVPNASVMMIEHAERFGLAQLHQLRGRVGRGAAASCCLLMCSQRCTEDGKQRLAVMAESNDGFRIAEADLAIRGPGEVLGTRQSGLPDFRVANLLRDGRILEEARQEAFRLVEDSNFIEDPRYDELRLELKKRWGGRLELAILG
ncbi:MAG: ATP-dependent DNA helicase RecG [Desulfuromonadales bacterium C00003094]|nr:MAG: ATP-dependent DNA helicase RecG [Desulfuromonadales bacterium C00003094]